MSRPARINVRMSDCISDGFESIPEFYTQHVPLRNGHGIWNAGWDRMKHFFSGGYISERDHYLEVKRLWAVCRGDVSAFRIRDPLDYEIGDEVLGVGTGSEQELQIYRKQEVDVYDYIDVIEAPIASTLIVKAGLTLGAAVPITATVDELTGIVTCTATSGHTIWVSCEFDRWVRFANRLPARYEDLASGITIEVVEDFGP